MRAATLVNALARSGGSMHGLLVFAISLPLLAGCNNSESTEGVTRNEKPAEPKPQGITPKIKVSDFPLSIADAERSMKGWTKEEVIALLGKPEQILETAGASYFYLERKYLKADIGNRDERPTGMKVLFTGDKVLGISRP